MNAPSRLRIVCVGGGPAGLTFARLAAGAGHEVTVHERRRTGTWGVGVTLWPDHLDRLRSVDPELAGQLRHHAVEWSGQAYFLEGDRIRESSGHGYGIARGAMVSVLESLALAAGATVHRGESDLSVSALTASADLLIAADGAASSVRSGIARLHTTTDLGETRYTWLDVARASSSFTFSFVRSCGEWLWVYLYPYRDGASTAVVEMSTAAWVANGFDTSSEQEALHRLSALFPHEFEGAALTPAPKPASQSMWSRFRHVRNRRWASGTTALIGDAAHTTHFSVGAGTELALDDAVALVRHLESDGGSVSESLASYSRDRRRATRGARRAAALSERFFEHLPSYAGRSASDFAQLLDHRRARLLPLVPTSAFLRIHRTLDRRRGSVRVS